MSILMDIAAVTYMEPPLPSVRAKEGTSAESDLDVGANFLELRGISKQFGQFVAVQDVSLDVRRGEFLTILGPSGCGKTTLLRIIAGLEKQNTGCVVFNGRDISDAPPAKRHFGIVFQSYALFPNLTTEQNIAYGMKAGRKKYTRRQIQRKVAELLDCVHLTGQDKKYPSQLSGGQQQRVALARALAIEPELLLLDEPLSALDARVRVRLRQMIRQIQQRLNVTTIMVTHDQEEALTMGDRVLVMDHGILKQCASPEEVYCRPSDSFVAGFVGRMNFLGTWEAGSATELRQGEAALQIPTGRVHPGRQVSLAIRPEDVHVCDSGTENPNTFDAEPHIIEFCGSYYRISAKAHISPERSVEVDIDVPAKQVGHLGINNGTPLRLELPADRLLLFNESPESEHV
jgi:iron(III) transport system ATP-binding protein